MLLIDVWAGLVGFAMILYVLLDGISLGVGLLFPAAADENERTTLMATISPVWDANQTWLVFGGAAIFAAFPVLFGVLASALYIPLMTFIMGLIFRGVTFEFRADATRKKPWDRAFFWGSLVAVLSQGTMLGGILTGINVSGREFAGSPIDWLNPFSVMVAIALIPGYILLASCYLIIKTTGPIQEQAYKYAFWSALAVLFFMAVVTVWTPFHYPLVWKNWFAPPRIYFVWCFPLMGLIALYKLLRSLKAAREVRASHVRHRPLSFRLFRFDHLSLPLCHTSRHHYLGRCGATREPVIYSVGRDHCLACSDRLRSLQLLRVQGEGRTGRVLRLEPGAAGWFTGFFNLADSRR